MRVIHGNIPDRTLPQDHWIFLKRPQPSVRLQIKWVYKHIFVCVCVSATIFISCFIRCFITCAVKEPVIGDRRFMELAYRWKIAFYFEVRKIYICIRTLGNFCFWQICNMCNLQFVNFMINMHIAHFPLTVWNYITLPNQWFWANSQYL